MQKILDYFNGDELAASVWKSKYAMEGEETPDDMHRRMAKEFARIEENYAKSDFIVFGDKNFHPSQISEYGRERIDTMSEEAIYQLFKDFKYIVPQGSIMSQLGAGSIGSLSNCFFVGSPVDSYGGIFQKDQQQVQLMKRRGGVGIDLSSLRPQGSGTSNAAKSSTGPVSFMNRYSESTREVAQDGRRGALLISMEINHPDILDFIKIKRDLTKITGANISVKLNKEFMEAVENDEDYILRWPCDMVMPEMDDTRSYEYNKLYPFQQTRLRGAHYKVIKAKEYWDELIKSAHSVAEPGLLFWDKVLDNGPDAVYDKFKPQGVNPCGEITLSEYDSCRLMAINLYSFVENPFTNEAYFNREKFYSVVYEAMRLSDDLVDLTLKMKLLKQ